MQAVPADFEPPFEQVELRALSRPIDTFDDDQRPRIRAGGFKRLSISRGSSGGSMGMVSAAVISSFAKGTSHQPKIIRAVCKKLVTRS